MIYAIEIGWYDMYPMEKKEKYKRYRVYAKVIDARGAAFSKNYKMNKTLKRKKYEDAYQIGMRWREDFLKNGYKVIPKTGCSFGQNNDLAN